jgi:hypothetical protein
VIVRANLAASGRRAVEIRQQLRHVVFVQNFKGFAQMLVAQVRWVTPHASPDPPCLSRGAADLEQLMEIVDKRAKSFKHRRKA